MRDVVDQCSLVLIKLALLVFFQLQGEVLFGIITRSAYALDEVPCLFTYALLVFATLKVCIVHPH